MHFHTSVSDELKTKAPLFSFNWIFLHQICFPFDYFWIPCSMLRFTLTTLVQTLRPLISGHVTRSLLVCYYEDTLGGLAVSNDHWMGHVFVRAGVLSLLSFLQLINKIIKIAIASTTHITINTEHYLFHSLARILLVWLRLRLKILC